jgi:hypothetical protein
VNAEMMALNYYDVVFAIIKDLQFEVFENILFYEK